VALHFAKFSKMLCPVAMEVHLIPCQQTHLKEENDTNFIKQANPRKLT
jgi:hypothetical protein